jgi:NCAIR mutase (PurE)-related protein
MSDFKQLLTDFEKGKISKEKILKELKFLPFENLKFAHVDHHRQLRQGFPEVIFCEGKSPSQVSKIAKAILANKVPLLATRAEPRVYLTLKKTIPNLEYNKLGRVIYSKPSKHHKNLDNKLMIISAGTSDIPVAEEAYQTAYMMGFRARKIYDVGVSGIHRLFNYMDEISEAKILIVVAGMEGALASVIGGMTSIPVIAVPTSTGYGTSFNGMAALLAMLNSCASGVTVVNIDNGFGAAFAAGQILELLVGEKE